MALSAVGGKNETASGANHQKLTKLSKSRNCTDIQNIPKAKQALHYIALTPAFDLTLLQVPGYPLLLLYNVQNNFAEEGKAFAPACASSETLPKLPEPCPEPSLKRA